MREHTYPDYLDRHLGFPEKGDVVGLATITAPLVDVFPQQLIVEFIIATTKLHIPEHSGHRFHLNPDNDSISFQTPIPFESGQ